MSLRDRSEEQPLWRRYLRFWGPDVRGDVDDELSFHLEMLVAENEAAGMSPAAAREAARQRFGSYESVERECHLIGEENRSMIRRTERLASVGQDVRYVLRSLAKSPGFTLATILVLALGLGANTTVFSVINGVLLRPLPFEEPERLVQLYETFPLAGGSSGEGSVSYANFADWREQSRSFQAMALSGWPGSVTLQEGGQPERLRATPVSASLFPMLGAQPLAGRYFAAGEDEVGAAPVAVLSEQAWRTRFGRDPGIVGKTLNLDGQVHTVVGIMPESFRFPAGSAASDVWLPLQVGDGQQQNRGNHAFAVLGRLKPGVEVEAAETEMRRIAGTLAAEYPDQQEGRSAVVRPLHEVVTGNVRPTLLVLLGAAGLVLLIACANAASLLLARSVGKRREVAIRTALGASRARIAAQFLTESLVLSGAGAAVGLLLAWGGLKAISAAATGMLPRATEIGLDGTVVAFLVVATVLTGVAFGLAPALQAVRTQPQQNLREGDRNGSTGRAGRAFRSTLVVAQVSLSLVLLVGAGLLMRTFVALLSAETGMATENVLTLQLSLPAQKYEDGEQAIQRFYQPMLERVRALPGVQSAGTINMLPLMAYGMNGNFGIAGKVYEGAGEQPFAEFRVASPGYFESLGIPVVRGRDVGAQDGPNAPPVAWVNQRMAEQYFPGEEAVGQQLTNLGPDPLTIAGVVGSVRQARLEDEPRAEVYLPYEQAGLWGLGSSTLVVRTGVDPMSLADEVRGAIREVAPDQPVFDVQSMQQVVRDSVSDRRIYLWLLGTFAGVALALAVMGIYGVISYSVTQRTREFGIRLALGSEVGRVSRMVVWQGGRLALLGLAVGLPAAYLLTRFLASILYGVAPADPVTYAAVAATLGVVALVASYVPAHRATRVDPMIAMRAE